MSKAFGQEVVPGGAEGTRAGGAGVGDRGANVVGEAAADAPVDGVALDPAADEQATVIRSTGTTHAMR